jgi:hypothetical protein
MEGAIQPVSAPVTCKHPAGTVAAVGSRSEADDQEFRTGITEARKRLSPIAFALVAPRRIRRHLLAPAHQPGTLPAIDNVCGELLDSTHAFGVNTKPTAGKIQDPNSAARLRR